jgi:hypothetical protein
VSSGWIRSATSPTDRSLFCGGRPRISNIEGDQKIAPRDRSHSHNPEWPAPQRRVEAGLRFRVYGIGLLGARRLRVEGEAEDHQTMLVATNTVAS